MLHFAVTGGCGFIGSHLVRRLLGSGHRVTVIDDLSSGHADSIPAGARLVQSDIAAPGILEPILREANGCFHLAAVVRAETGGQDWRRSMLTNAAGTLCVLEAAKASGHRPKPVVYASSCAVYGSPVVVPTPETAAPRPMTAYGAYKLAGELHARLAWREHGIPSVGLRLFDVYGPGQDPESPYASMIPLFADRIRRAASLPIGGNGEQVRDLVWVEDAVDHFLAAMKSCRDGAEGARLYNVCTGHPTNLEQVATQMMHLLGRAVGCGAGCLDESQVRVSLGSPRLAARELGATCRTLLPDGLRLALCVPPPDRPAAVA